jgi:hypothetical protein
MTARAGGPPGPAAGAAAVAAVFLLVALDGDNRADAALAEPAALAGAAARLRGHRAAGAGCGPARAALQEEAGNDAQ